MSLYTFQTTDKLPAIQIPDGLRIEECTNLDLLAWMASSSKAEMTMRFANDHVAFVAYINDLPAAFGWMARGKASIGELQHDIILPVGNRYLWNFRTMEAFRGRGIYPALLQYIISHEREKANRFWIIHAPENKSSLEGIKKAGFQFVGRMYSNKGVATIGNISLFGGVVELLGEMGVIISNAEAASCWNCSSPYLKKRSLECCCIASGSECVGNNLFSLAS